MAKKKQNENTSENDADNPAESGNHAAANGTNGKPPSVASYFRNLFKFSPSLLQEKSNDKILERWLADHPDQTEVPKSVKQNLANLKSILRSKARENKAHHTEDAQQPGRRSHVETQPTGNSPLEVLEHHIDECLHLAKVADREGLEGVIGLLRRARNAVVWKFGQ